MCYKVEGRLSLLIVSQKKEKGNLEFENQLSFIGRIISFFRTIDEIKEKNFYKKNNFEIYINCFSEIENFRINFVNAGEDLFRLKKEKRVLRITRKGNLEMTLINLRNLFLEIDGLLEKDALIDLKKGVLLVPEKFLCSLNMRVEIFVGDLGKFYIYF